VDPTMEVCPNPGNNTPSEFLGEIKIEKGIRKLKNYFISPIYKKGDKTDYSNFRGISLLSSSWKFFSNILLPRLNPYIDEIIGDHQRGFRWD
jgi:hypothetical protein